MENKRKINILPYIVFLVFSFIVIPTNVLAKDNTFVEDKGKGTAVAWKEAVIAAGTELVGKVDYHMNIQPNGHGPYSVLENYDPSPPAGLDCSSFVAWSFAKGAGIGFGNTVPITYTWLNEYNEYKVNVSKFSEVKRGDIVVTSGGGHVVIGLGNNQYMASDGSDEQFRAGTPNGPTIKNDWGQDIVGVYRLPDNLDEVFKNPKITKQKKDSKFSNVEGKEEGDGNETEGESLGSKLNRKMPLPIIHFQERVYENKPLGLKKDAQVVTPASIIKINRYSTQIEKYLYRTMFLGGIALLTYISVAFLFYLAVMPRTGSIKVMDRFEKATGVSAIPDTNGVLDFLGKGMISITIIAISITNLPTYLFVVLFDFIGTII